MSNKHHTHTRIYIYTTSKPLDGKNRPSQSQEKYFGCQKTEAAEAFIRAAVSISSEKESISATAIRDGEEPLIWGCWPPPYSKRFPYDLLAIVLQSEILILHFGFPSKHQQKLFTNIHGTRNFAISWENLLTLGNMCHLRKRFSHKEHISQVNFPTCNLRNAKVGRVCVQNLLVFFLLLTGIKIAGSNAQKPFQDQHTKKSKNTWTSQYLSHLSLWHTSWSQQGAKACARHAPGGLPPKVKREGYL